MPRGSKHPQTFTDREKALIMAFYCEGKTDEQVAKVLGMQRMSLRWVLAHPVNSIEVDGKPMLLWDRILELKKDPDSKVEASLYKRALGYEYEEVETVEGPDGKIKKIKKVKKHIPSETLAGIFWVKNRRPARWRDKTEVNLDMPQLMTLFARDPYEKKVEEGDAVKREKEDVVKRKREKS